MKRFSLTIVAAVFAIASGISADGRAPSARPADVTIAIDHPAIMADGACRSAVTAFVRDQFGHAFPNANVVFSFIDSPSGMVASSVVGVTNSLGQFTSYLSSSTPGTVEVAANASQYVGSVYYEVTVNLPSQVFFVWANPIVWGESVGMSRTWGDTSGDASGSTFATASSNSGSVVLIANGSTDGTQAFTGHVSTVGENFWVRRIVQWEYDSASPSVPPVGWKFTESFAACASASAQADDPLHSSATMTVSSTLPLDLGYSTVPDVGADAYEGTDTDDTDWVIFKSPVQAVPLGATEQLAYQISFAAESSVTSLGAAPVAYARASVDGHYRIEGCDTWHEHINVAY